MPRGDIQETIARMEELRKELHALEERFEALSRSNVGKLCTEPDLQLQRWAGWYADRLRRTGWEVERKIEIARQGKAGNEPPEP